MVLAAGPLLLLTTDGEKRKFRPKLKWMRSSVFRGKYVPLNVMDII